VNMMVSQSPAEVFHADRIFRRLTWEFSAGKVRFGEFRSILWVILCGKELRYWRLKINFEAARLEALIRRPHHREALMLEEVAPRGVELQPVFQSSSQSVVYLVSQIS
jgi:hypothetical protein